MIRVSSNVQRIARELGARKEKIAPATRAALNRVGVTLRKEARQNLAKATNARRQGDAAKAIALNRATASRLRVEVVTLDRSLPLADSKDTRVQSGGRGRRSQRVTFRGKLIQGAFRPAKLPRFKGVITAKEPGRYASGTRRLKWLFAYSFLQETKKRRLLDKLEPVARARFDVEIHRALSYLAR